jgi:glycosyltransferase involved in cell wall biosynthesis
MVTTFYPPFHFGGDAIYVYRLANKLAELGHQVDVIHCLDAYRALSGQAGPSPPSHENIRIHSLQSKAKAFSPLLTQQTGRMMLKKSAIERIIEQGDFDVIHYHNVSLIGGLDVLAPGRAVKLYTVHEYWLVCPTHVMFKDMCRACDSPECFRCQLIYRRPPQLWRTKSYFRKMLRHVDRFLVPNRFTAELHKERGVELNSDILPMFIEWPEQEKSPASPLPPGLKDYFLFAGRLEKLKGLQDVIPQFVNLPDLNLVVAGTGHYEKQLKQLAKGISNIYFLGALPPPDLQQLYQGALASLIPSICYETGPLILGESWSCGTPVITRAIGSMAELVVHSGGGLCFQDTDELRSHLQRIAADRSLREHLGAAGHDTYLREWTPGKHIQRYFKIIDSIQA